MRNLLLALTVLLALTMLAVPAAAQSPTATPTLLPIPASPTSSYLYLRPTPSPFVFGTPVDLHFNADGGQLADTAINVYRYGNRDHIFDFIGTALLIFVGLAYLIRIIERQTKESD